MDGGVICASSGMNPKLMVVSQQFVRENAGQKSCWDNSLQAAHDCWCVKSEQSRRGWSDPQQNDPPVCQQLLSSCSAE